MDTKYVAQKIKEARKSAGLTQVGLAAVCNCSAASVSKWETGLAFPERERWETLEKVLNLPHGWFWNLQATGNVVLPALQVRGEATNTPPEPPSNSGTIRQVVEDQGTPTFMTVYDYSKGRLTQVETKERLHKLRDGVYMVERDDPFDTLTGPAMNSLRDWWRKKHGDTHNSAAQFVMELGRRFPEMSPVVQIVTDKPGGGQGK